MKKYQEVKAYEISDDFKFMVTQVVITHSKDIAMYWTRDNVGYTNEEMAKLKVREFPLHEKVFVRDFGETSAREMIEEAVQEVYFTGFPIVVFWKEAKNDYYENWHSHFEIEDPTE
jgi:hypothetical protein